MAALAKVDKDKVEVTVGRTSITRDRAAVVLSWNRGGNGTDSEKCLMLQLRVVQLNFIPEMEVFYLLFNRYPSMFSMTSLKQHMEYFNSQCKIQLDLPV